MIPLDQAQAMLEPLFPGLMGVRLTELAPDRVRAEMLVRPELCTAGGILHGGAAMALADTLGAIGAFLSTPEGKRTTTLESKTNFIGSAKAGSTVVATATPLHVGRRSSVWTTRLETEAREGEDGKLVAVVTQTQMTVE
jgi:uncharacterized protein (TIGR00369 family)